MTTELVTRDPNPTSRSQSASAAAAAHLELVLLPGVALAPDVLLQVHVVFERLSGGREGNRGQKLNRQRRNTHTERGREGERGEEEGEREGGGRKTQFQRLEEDARRL